jgi:hypothetical protein
MTVKERVKRRPNLSMLALASFIASFTVSRTFATLSPGTVLISGDFHIHHFWYGIALLAIGGWLGISYESARTNHLAAIFFGAGGGIIGDEFGLLLTLGDYWTGITYTLVTILLTCASAIILINRYSSMIRIEFAHFSRSNASFYFGVLLAAVSIALALETDDPLTIVFSGLLTIIACIVVLAYFVNRVRLRGKKNMQNICPSFEENPKELRL